MTDKWIKDTGEVLALILLFFGISSGSKYLLILALIALFINVINYKIFRPLAFIWQKISSILALVMPRIFFGFVFYVIITPVGFVRKLLGYDSLNLKNNNTKSSSFVFRNHSFSKKDLRSPY